MPKFGVKLVEAHEQIFRVEAADEAEARQLVEDGDKRAVADGPAVYSYTLEAEDWVVFKD